MKELTAQEKAKAYDEALERARAINNGKDVDIEAGTTICEYIFPELKENEDGKMWKLIKKYVHSNISDMALKADHITRKQLETWLEKQEFVNKEYTFKAIPRLLEMIQPTDRAKSYCQKLIDSLEQEGYSTDAMIVRDWLKTMNGEKVAMATMDEQKVANETEPKFKVGDWIVNKTSNLVYRVDSILFPQSKCYYLSHNGEIVLVNFTDEQNYRPWTIRDAREGDVLSNDNHILILKELVYDWSSNGTPYSVKAYCGINPNGNFEIGKDNWCFCGTLHIHPATKEQCNTLKKAMADAGYIFDFDKKELKKIDQKSYGQRKECLYCQFNHAGECKGSCQMKINEQIHIDKIESKFKVGNWYQCTKDFFGKGVTFDKGTAYYCAKEGCLLDGCHIAIVKDLYDNFKQWTIDDAKKGDVLVDKYGNIGIYQGDKNAVTWDSYCYCGVNKGFYGKGSHEFPCYPASEEQRGLLFQKMKEAGYEWNAEKKELREIEQKPTEDVDLPEFESYLCLMFQKFRTKGICTNGEIINFVEEHSQKLKDTLCRAWSKEDENNILFLTSIIEECFKDKEEITLCSDTVCANFTKEDVIDRLKSLRPQNRWKPSDGHYELEEFAKIVRCNLTGISKAVQKLFEAKYLQLTGNKMYGGFKD